MLQMALIEPRIITIICVIGLESFLAAVTIELLEKKLMPLSNRFMSLSGDLDVSEVLVCPAAD
jgi:hypothetical protein